MSPIAAKMRVIKAAAVTNCGAVALAEQSAALVSFQRLEPSLPPTQNVNSAVSPVLPAMQFSGNSAITAVIAAIAVTTATF